MEQTMMKQDIMEQTIADQNLMDQNLTNQNQLDQNLTDQNLTDQNQLDQNLIRQMIQLAIRQLQYSYTPYSGFRVGAALLSKSGKLYTGCNIENAAYTPTNCAERTAFFKAVSEGEREFQAICVVGGKDGILTGYAAPCGVCRQVMMEFCDPKKFQIILATGTDHYDVYTLEELLPQGFGPANLEMNGK